METAYDYLSVNDDFWIQFKSSLISFGFKGLPKDIHLTISFHPDNPRINFHVSKNTHNALSKPKIAIVEIEKSTLAQISDTLVSKIYRTMLKPFDLRQFTLDNRNNVGFLSFDLLQKENFGMQMEDALKNTLSPITTFRRKTRVKIKGDISQRLQGFVESEEQLKQLERYLVKVRYIQKEGNVSGVLISKRYVKTVIRINSRWFEFKPLNNFNEVLNSILGKENSHALIKRYKSAIKLVLKAKSYQDVEQYDKPQGLVLRYPS